MHLPVRTCYPSGLVQTAHSPCSSTRSFTPLRSTVQYSSTEACTISIGTVPSCLPLPSQSQLTLREKRKKEKGKDRRKNKKYFAPVTHTHNHSYSSTHTCVCTRMQRKEFNLESSRTQKGTNKQKGFTQGLWMGGRTYCTRAL